MSDIYNNTNLKISVVTPVYNENDSLKYLINDLISKIGKNLLEIIIIYHPNSNKDCINKLFNLRNGFKVIKLILISNLFLHSQRAPGA